MASEAYTWNEYEVHVSAVIGLFNVLWLRLCKKLNNDFYRSSLRREWLLFRLFTRTPSTPKHTALK